MKIYRTSDPMEALRLYRECLGGHEGLIVHIADSVFVETGAFPTCDIATCNQLGIPICKAQYLGGSIVCFPGDLSLCEVHWGPSDFAPRIVERAAEWLENRGLAVKRDGNDILVDGRKVVSWARSTSIEGWVQSVVHFSIVSDEALIEQLCTKEMLKRPGALDDYGITAEDILAALELGGGSKWTS